ncbi:NADP-dependent oxidoreductase [Granulicoccus sp. GXG6511]|uniref:NADP-dependent oxidoreductase n=1 Tax=Granulicoccus sp. GXG6511 TaxID=3381351 RepID=UPI003D7C4D97
MRAALIDRFGGPEELHIGEVPVPEPSAGEVLVRMLSAGTNPLDYKIRDGSSGMAKKLTADDFPLILGREGCGVVEALGPGVSGLEVGQTVFGMPALTHRAGCYAEYAALPVNCLAPVPVDADPIVFGGTALVLSTALTAAIDQGRVSEGENVLIHGGTGGVGQLAVQLCRRAGAQVWATASTRNQDRLVDLGANPIDYSTQDFTQASPKMDLIIDGAYFDTFLPSLDHLVEGGRIVVLPSLADLTPAKERGIEAHIPVFGPMPDRLAELAPDVASGALSIEVAEVLPLDRVADAHRQLETGHSRGKIILDLR